MGKKMKLSKIKNIKALKLSLLTIGLLTAGLSNIVIAQEQDVNSQVKVKEKSNLDDVEESDFERIMVTATRRSTSLQDTAMSISAVTGESLDNMGYANISDFIASVPGVSLASDGPGMSKPTIRGVATSIAGAGNATVASYINDFPLNGADGQPGSIQLVDMQRVEILKGPQGTLFGRDSMAGTLRYITNRPDSSEIEGGVTTSVSDTADGSNNFTGSGFLNLPLTDDLAVRGVLYANDTSGYIDNTLTGKQDVNGDEVFGGRLALSYFISDNISLDVNYLSNEVKANGVSYNHPNITGIEIDKGYAQYVPIEQPYSLKNEQLSFTLETSFDAFDLTTAASRSWFERSSIRDVTLFIEPDYSNVSVSEELAFENINDTFEMRAVSNSDSMVDWLVGVWYENGDGWDNSYSENDGAFNLFGQIPLPAETNLSNRISTQKNKSLAVYGEVGIHLSEATTLILGYRHASIETSELYSTLDGVFSQFTGATALVGADLSAEEDVDTYKVHVEHIINDDLLVYTSAASGFRSGGFNDPTPVSPLTTYDSDTLWNYELGVKASLLDQNLTANAVIYQIDWEDMQLESTNKDTGSGGTFNVGESQIQGLEVELIYYVSQELQIGVFYNYSNGELTQDYINNGNIIGAKGDRLPASAETSFTFYAEWDKSLDNGWDVFARLNHRIVGDQTINFNKQQSLANNQIEKLPSYKILDVRAGVEMPMDGIQILKVSLFASNLTNEVALMGFNNFFGQSIYTNRPRTIGVEVNYSF
jgi:iron complex outermembrane receptor protein